MARPDFAEMIPSTLYGKLTLFAVLIEAITVIILESVVAAIFWKYYNPGEAIGVGGATRGVPVYLIIFIIAQLFQIVLCWDAVWHKNTIQIVGFVAFNLCVCAYSIFQYSQMIGIVNNSAAALLEHDKQTLQAVLIVIPIVVAVFEAMFLFFAFKLYLEFGWKIYKKIGADPKMRNMYRVYQIFLMLLKLDVFFVSGFGVQFLVLVIHSNDPEFALTIAALPIMMIILVLAVYGVRREDKWIMGLFCVGLVLAMAYFIFKLARIYTRQDDPRYKDTKNYLTFFASLSLAVVLGTLVNAILCYRNFGRGLKQHIMSSSSNVTELASAGPARKPLEE
ncbi:hypothetical protein HK104_005863 [Borealophlyctis nickersoniae]|nr:hypothetical protein HK104_005863 [Borealophlyctis nickersoniae]